MYLVLDETAFISLILDTTRYVGAKVRCKIDFWIEKSDKQPQDLVFSFSRELKCVIHCQANINKVLKSHFLDWPQRQTELLSCWL